MQNKNRCFELTDSTINKFTVSQGQVVYLRVTQKNKRAILTKNNKLFLVNIATKYNSFSYFFSKHTVKNYLLKNAPSLEGKYEDIINKIKIPSGNMALKALYGGLMDRMSLNIWIAFTKKDFIILDLAGMSPIGMYTNTLQTLYNVSAKPKVKSSIVLDVVNGSEPEKILILNHKNIREIFDRSSH